jgi:hypothetical protein
MGNAQYTEGINTYSEGFPTDIVFEQTPEDHLRITDDGDFLINEDDEFLEIN